MVIKKTFLHLHINKNDGAFSLILKNRAMKTSKSDFRFKLVGYGLYSVTYTSPKTGKQWTSKIDDMTLIDATKNTSAPKLCDLENLKRICKA